MAVLVYFFVAVLAIASLANATDFCTLKTCREGSHTMCLFTSPKPSSRCNSYQAHSLTSQEKQEILAAHNKLRALVASGREKRGVSGGQPAGRIGPLEWDEELEEVAQRWANQCDFKHDFCRNVDRFNVGQNIAYQMQSNEYDGNLTKMVRRWYDEVKLFNARDISQYQFDKRTGHYTQLVWGETTTIGCGLVKYMEYQKGINWFTTYLVCNYGPAGNIIGQPMYKTL